MEFRTLQYFLTVVREENLSRAAQILHVTQPTLSRQMAQLEEELGAQLFIRGRRLTITEEGAMLRRRAQEVLELMDKIEIEFEEKEELGGVISIGYGGLNASRILSEAMIGFRRLHPKIQYEIYANSAEYVTERLDKGLLDFGLLLEPVDMGKYDYFRLRAKDRVGIFMSTGCPLVEKTCVTKEDLTGLPLFTPNRLSVQKELSAWLGDDLESLDIFATGNLIISNTAQLIESGEIYALTVDGAVDLFQSEKLTFRPLYPELSMTSVLAWKKLQPSSGAARAFLEYVKDMR